MLRYSIRNHSIYADNSQYQRHSSRNGQHHQREDEPPARQRLEQAISNLLGNAVRHTPPGGLVAATVSAEPACVRVDVRDTGEGITAAEVPHLFERFFRGRSQNGHAGAGLGLALVKELTEAMGGSVEANSTPGEGSCFTIRLPKA